MPILGVVASANQQGRVEPGSYDALASVTVPSGGLASLAFSGIPAGYRHLQLRTSVQQQSTGGYIEIILGGATFVRRHYITGSGSSSVIAGADTTNAPGIFSSAASSGSTVFGPSVLDILDYASTKNKVTRSVGGTDNNGSGGVYFMSSLYTSTSAVASITINAIITNFAEHSSFTLYGVK